VGKMNNYLSQSCQKFLPSLTPERFGQIEDDSLEDPVLPAVAEKAVAAGYLLPGDRLAGSASLELVDLVAVAVALEVAIVLLNLGHEPRHGKVPDALGHPFDAESLADLVVTGVDPAYLPRVPRIVERLRRHSKP